jgi:hypothetical protein
MLVEGCGQVLGAMAGHRMFLYLEGSEERTLHDIIP